MPAGSLLLLAGPNGAGKTTLLQSVRDELGLTTYRLLNADDRTLQKMILAGLRGFDDDSVDGATLKKFFIEAATEVHEEALRLLESGKAVCLETVLSTDKFCRIVTDLMETGGQFELVYVALRNAEISKDRIRERVRKKGHDVPVNRLQERWERSLSFLPWFARRAQSVTIYDNSGPLPLVIASGGGGTMSWMVPRDTVFPELRLALEAEFPELKQT